MTSLQCTLKEQVTRAKEQNSQDHWVAAMRLSYYHQEIDLRGVPPHILHKFALDCAKCALEIGKKFDRVIDSRIWEAFQGKKDWLQGEIGREELYELRRKADQAYWELASEAKRGAEPEDSYNAYSLQLSIYRTVCGALSENARVAARSAAKEATHSAYPTSWGMEVEREWQQKRLSELLLDYFWKPFCEAVIFCVKQQTEVVPAFEENLEEALFQA